jgi:hypothetical protein
MIFIQKKKKNQLPSLRIVSVNSSRRFQTGKGNYFFIQKNETFRDLSNNHTSEIIDYGWSYEFHCYLSTREGQDSRLLYHMQVQERTEERR